MKLFSSKISAVAAIAMSLVASGAVAQSAANATNGASTFNGRWDASFTVENNPIPFRLDITGDGPTLKGTLYNGEETETTTSAKVENGAIVLDFEHYLTTITASPKDGVLQGTLQGRFERDKYIAGYPFVARPYVPVDLSSVQAPSIDGVWEIPYDSQKGEKAWRFIVEQKGAQVSAAILRVDGDTGALTGHFQDGKFVLSHFDGSRPLVLEVTPKADGTLELKAKGAYTTDKTLTAYRPAEARAKGLPEPADFVKHTTVKDPNERFAFSFPDVNGKTVSNDDPRFKDKVVIAVVTGTWCPNCHDEAQYLVQLYKKYHDKGLEIVALDFEEPEQQDTLAREKAFVKQYHVPYTYLIAGAPNEMWEKVPQAVNLNTWPATLFIGRDGKVKLIHSGFAAPASGVFNAQLKDEFTSTIEKLLAEPDSGTTTASLGGKSGR